MFGFETFVNYSKETVDKILNTILYRVLFILVEITVLKDYNLRICLVNYKSRILQSGTLQNKEDLILLEPLPTWHGPRYAKVFPFWYKVHKLLYSTLSVSQTGSRVWSQFNCLGTHSCWLHLNFPKLVKQTCFFGMHLHKVIIISCHCKKKTTNQPKNPLKIVRKKTTVKSFPVLYRALVQQNWRKCMWQNILIRQFRQLQDHYKPGTCSHHI